jgi:hypothetical protein
MGDFEDASNFGKSKATPDFKGKGLSQLIGQLFNLFTEKISFFGIFQRRIKPMIVIALKLNYLPITFLSPSFAATTIKSKIPHNRKCKRQIGRTALPFLLIIPKLNQSILK